MVSNSHARKTILATTLNNLMKKNYYFLLTLLLGLATYKAATLSLDQWQNPGACPSIGPVPACYIVLAGFTTALIGHLGKIRRAFLLGLGVPTTLAAFASVGETLGFIVCPRTEGGIPMCYISLALCCTIWILWFLMNNIHTTQKNKPTL